MVHVDVLFFHVDYCQCGCVLPRLNVAARVVIVVVAVVVVVIVVIVVIVVVVFVGCFCFMLICPLSMFLCSCCWLK